MNYDTNRVKELVEQYSEAETRQECRAIEDEILKATVWQGTHYFEEMEVPFATFTEKEFERIAQEVETTDKEVQRLLRQPYVKLL